MVIFLKLQQYLHNCPICARSNSCNFLNQSMEQLDIPPITSQWLNLKSCCECVHFPLWCLLFLWPMILKGIISCLWNWFSILKTKHLTVQAGIWRESNQWSFNIIRTWNKHFLSPHTACPAEYSFVSILHLPLLFYS